VSTEQGSWIEHHVSRQFANPFKLALDLLREPNPAARSAMFMAGCGLLLTPLDMALAAFERRLYARARTPTRPILLVAGPPRSGTTLVAQTLINRLDVAYPNNLTALFPRSPVLSNTLLRRLARPRPGSYDAFYGKSTGLAGANDALYLWDRWLGADRARVPERLVAGSEVSLPRFFGAFQALHDKPIVNKVNRLNTCAHIVAPVLPAAHFIFLQRDPLMLAQSLYVARARIVGDLSRAYGVQHPDPCREDPVEDVCRQVLFLEAQLLAQRDRLSAERCWVISYEEFCARPGALVARVRRAFPDIAGRAPAPEIMTPFEVSKRRQLADDTMQRLQRRLAELGAGRVACDPLQD
jgi:Sulfotransferase family